MQQGGDLGRVLGVDVVVGRAEPLGSTAGQRRHRGIDGGVLR